MANQGFHLDQPVIATTAAKFDETATNIRGLMGRLSADLTGLVGSAQNFNGAARLAFDASYQALNDRIMRAQTQLTAIGEAFNKVMNEHDALSNTQQSDIMRVAQLAVQSPIVSGLNH